MYIYMRHQWHTHLWVKSSLIFGYFNRIVSFLDIYKEPLVIWTIQRRSKCRGPGERVAEDETPDITLDVDSDIDGQLG